MDVQQFETRKQDHIRHALDPSNQAGEPSGFDRLRLVHEALPELNASDVSLQTSIFGRRQETRTPFFVPGMTAGHAQGTQLNWLLAEQCQKRGWVLGVGSQRRTLDSADHSEWSEFRRRFPALVSVGNIGLSQILNRSTSDLLRLAEAMGSAALAVHLNPLQEILQPEGTPEFKGGLHALERLCRESQLPIVVKETGCGFSVRTLKRLLNLGIAAVDLSGRGGTHWGRIEGRRAAPDSVQSAAAETFKSWGESTVDSLLHAKEALSGSIPIWASGGLRSGLDAAKAIALGAERVGLAQPALKAALVGEEALDRWMSQMEFELKVALFCTGSSTPQDLRGRPDSWAWSS